MKGHNDHILSNYVLAVSICLAFAIVNGIRSTVGVAMVYLEGKDNQTWTPATIGIVESSFFYGYGLTQIIGGVLSHRYSAIQVFGTSVLVTSSLHMLSPILILYTAPWTLIMMRFVQGAVEGCLLSANHGIWSSLSGPQSGQSGLVTLTMSGTYLGYVFGMPLSGLLTSQVGWQAPILFYGSLGLSWVLLFSVVVTLTAANKRILKQMSSRAKSKNDDFVPWKAMIRSRAVIVIALVFVANDWTTYMVSTNQPQYFHDVLHMQVGKGSIARALPHVLKTIMVPLSGQLADLAIRKTGFHILSIRKFFTCLGFGLSTLFFMGLVLLQDKTLLELCLIFGYGLTGIPLAGFTMNILDVTSTHASIVAGWCNTIGNFSGGLVPIFIKMLTEGQERVDGWHEIMIITIVLQAVVTLLYGLLADSTPLDTRDNNANDLPLKCTGHVKGDDKLYGSIIDF